MTTVRNLVPSDVMELNIIVANTTIRIEVQTDNVIVSRVKDSKYITVYEEYKLPDGQWGSRTNTLADFPPRRKKSVDKCIFCNKEFPDNPDCIDDEGWIPTFWIPDLGPGVPESEVFGPVCGNCCDNYLEDNEESGDLQVKDRFIGAALRKTTLYSREKIDSLVSNHQKRSYEPYTIYVL